MPAAYGAVEPWSELVTLALVGAIALCLALKYLLHPEFTLRRSIAFIPIAAFIGLALLQMVWFPSDLINTISPNTYRLKLRLLQQLPAVGTLDEPMTLAFYLHATRHDLRLILIATTVFFVVLNVYRTPEQIKRLLTTIVCIGGAVAVLALVQDATQTDSIYWLVQLPHPAISGTFVSHTHFAQFMNLSMGAAIALLLVRLREYGAPRGQSQWTPVLLLSGMIVAGIASIICSRTRAGVFSMLFAGMLFWMLAAMRQRARKAAWAALVATLCLSALVFYRMDLVVDRVSSMQYDASRRVQIFREIVGVCKTFPVFGVGLGNHEYVFPGFQQTLIGGRSTHAENEYLQVIEEMGLPGLFLVLSFVALLVVAGVRTIRRLDSSISGAVFGLGFGLLAVMIHSLSDFGQHLLANLCLSSIFSALLLNLARTGTSSEPVMRRVPSLRWARVPACLLVAGVWGWALSHAAANWRADRLWSVAWPLEERIRDRAWQVPDEESAKLIGMAEKAVAICPNNILYRHWLTEYRWNAACHTRDPHTDKLIISPEAVAATQDAVDDLQRSLTLCPTFGPTWLFMGQLEHSILKHPDGKQHIHIGYQLARTARYSGLVAHEMAEDYTRER